MHTTNSTQPRPDFEEKQGHVPPERNPPPLDPTPSPIPSDH